MEHRGIVVDLELLRNQGKVIAKKISVIRLRILSLQQPIDLSPSRQIVEKEVHAAAGCEFTVASVPQLRAIIFDKLKLDAGKMRFLLLSSHRLLIICRSETGQDSERRRENNG